MILVLAGTSEGREAVKLLLREGLPVMATVTTEYGARLLKEEGLKKVVTGKQSEKSLCDLIKNNGIGLIIDATHPFAVEISSIALKTAQELEVAYVRLEREETPLPESPLIVTSHTLENAVEEALSIGGTLFSALGSKHLPYLVKKAKMTGTKIVARVLPTPAVIEGCFNLGLKPEEIIAVKGPFSKDLNKEFFREYGAEVVITKDSGKEGGLQAKLEAALELNIPCIVWKRPNLDYPHVIHSPEEIVSELRIYNLRRLYT
jgi:precorrin-6A/cobalt-precorrin-6A reductase